MAAPNKSLQVTFDPPLTFATAKAGVASNAPELRRYVSRGKVKQMKNAVALVFAGFLASDLAFAIDHYCTYFGGVNDRTAHDSLELFQLEKNGCKAGDALHLIIYDRSKSVNGREVMYMADDVTELCDLDKPVTIVGQVASGSTEAGALHAVCTYSGSRREARQTPDQR